MMIIPGSSLSKSNSRWYEIADLNSEPYLFLLHDIDDVSWLTIDDSCGLAVVSYGIWD